MLFFHNYERPGPGVSKDQPPKPPFLLFWELIARKFTNLICLNLLFFLPVAVLAFCAYWMGTLAPFLSAVPLIFVFPFLAGLTFVTRNYVRQEHAFLFSDFVDAVRNNWLPFLLNGVICSAASVLLATAVSFYSARTGSGLLFYIPLVICAGMGILFLFAQYYIPVQIVTFDLKLRQIYKNAFLFSMIGLWRNLLLTVILGVLVFGIYLLILLSPLTFLIAIVLGATLLFSFSMFLINFTVYPLIARTMIQPYQDGADQEEKKPSSGEDPGAKK